MPFVRLRCCLSRTMCGKISTPSWRNSFRHRSRSVSVPCQRRQAATRRASRCVRCATKRSRRRSDRCRRCRRSSSTAQRRTLQSSFVLWSLPSTRALGSVARFVCALRLTFAHSLLAVRAYRAVLGEAAAAPPRSSPHGDGESIQYGRSLGRKVHHRTHGT